MNRVLTLVLSSVLFVGLTLSENVSVEKSAALHSGEGNSGRDKRTQKVFNDGIFKKSDVYERRLSNGPRNEENGDTHSWSNFHYSDPEANLYKPDNIDINRRLKTRNRNPTEPAVFPKNPRSSHDDIFDKDEITELFKTTHFDYGKFVKKHQKDIKLSGNDDNLKIHNIHSSKTRDNKKTTKQKNREKEIQTYDFGNFQKQLAPDYEEIFKSTTGTQIKDSENFKHAFESELNFGHLKNSYGDLIGQEMNIDSGKSGQDLQNNHATNYGFSFEIKHTGNPSTSSNSFGSYSSPGAKKTNKYFTPILKEKKKTPYVSEFETEKSPFTSTSTFQPNISPDSFKTTYGTPNWNDYIDNKYVSLFDNQGNPISSSPSLINSLESHKLLNSQYSTAEWNNEAANTFKPAFDNEDVSLSSTPATLQDNMGNNWSYSGNNGFTPILSKDQFQSQPSKDIFQNQPSNPNALLNQASDNDLFKNQHLNGIFQNQPANGGFQNQPANDAFQNQPVNGFFQNKPADVFDGNAGNSQGQRDSFNSGFEGSNYFNLKDSPKNNLMEFDEFKPSALNTQTIIVPVPQPYPVKVPLTKAVAVPVIQEIMVPIEREVPYPVYTHVPFPIVKRVPFKVDKQVAVPVIKPYPVKIPVIQNVYHHSSDYQTDNDPEEMIDYSESSQLSWKARPNVPSSRIPYEESMENQRPFNNPYTDSWKKDRPNKKAQRPPWSYNEPSKYQDQEPWASDTPNDYNEDDEWENSNAEGPISWQSNQQQNRPDCRPTGKYRPFKKEKNPSPWESETPRKNKNQKRKREKPKKNMNMVEEWITRPMKNLAHTLESWDNEKPEHLNYDSWDNERPTNNFDHQPWEPASPPQNLGHHSWDNDRPVKNSNNFEPWNNKRPYDTINYSWDVEKPSKHRNNKFESWNNAKPFNYHDYELLENDKPMKNLNFQSWENAWPAKNHQQDSWVDDDANFNSNYELLEDTYTPWENDGSVKSTRNEPWKNKGSRKNQKKSQKNRIRNRERHRG